MPKKNKPPFMTGDRVTSAFYPEQAAIIRKITRCDRNEIWGSGFIASADGGEPCEKCNRTEKPIIWVDAKWFKKMVPNG